ncbi:MAG TPA: hypothetical protein VF232_06610 [Gaiellaceae bacterium]
MPAVRAPWTSASFLLYAGGLVILSATLSLLGTLGGDYGAAAFVGWSALVFVVLLDLAVGFRVARRPLAAGLFALSMVVALAVFVGALEEWAGWLAHTDSPFSGFHLDHFVIELTLLIGAVAARSVFRFPLLVLVSTGAAWFFVTDLLSNGGNWSAIVTLFFGLVALLVGLGADSVYGFWVQVVAGLTIGGALLTFWHSSNFDWIMIAIASVLYVLLGSAIGRSSYAVLGAFGLFLVTSHFAFKWFLPFRISFFGEEPETTRPWAAALSYAVYGLFLMLLGVWIARRRGAAGPV